VTSAQFLSSLSLAEIWGESKTLKAKESLLEVGEIGQEIFLIESGCLCIANCLEVELQVHRFAYQDNIIAPLDSLIAQRASRYCIIALRQSKVRAAKQEDFLNFIGQDQEKLWAWVGFQQQLILDLLEREQDLLLKSPKDRLEAVLKRSPKLFQEAPLKYIASYLRMSPETLSRLMNS